MFLKFCPYLWLDTIVVDEAMSNIPRRKAKVK